MMGRMEFSCALIRPQKDCLGFYSPSKIMLNSKSTGSFGSQENFGTTWSGKERAAMPVREWRRHATSASDDHAPGKARRALQHGFDVRNCPAQEPRIDPRALQKRAGRARGPHGALYIALTWLALLLTIMAGRPAAQTLPPGNEPTPPPVLAFRDPPSPRNGRPLRNAARQASPTPALGL